MKTVLLFTSAVLLTLNLLFGLILSSYNWFNVAVSSSVIIITVILSLLANGITIKDGFKVSLLILYSVIGIIQYLLAVFMPSVFTDNWCLIAIIVLLGVDILLLAVYSITSKRIY